jgi:hypothetical protein
LDYWRIRIEAIGESLMIAFSVVVLDVLHHGLPERSPIGINRSRHSSLIDRTNRSACAFALGARSGVNAMRVPA